MEQLFNSTWDIYYFYQAYLNKNTIYFLMLQLMTDQFLIKEEFNHMRDDDDQLVPVLDDDDDNTEL